MERELGSMGGIGEGGSGFNRHDTPARNASESDPVSEDYSDMTEGGVEHAKEVARTEILQTIDSAPEGAVLFIGGKSDQVRAGQTAEIWGEELQRISDDRKDLVVLTKEDIDDLIYENTQDRFKMHGETIHWIKKLIDNNTGRKIVLVYPLFIKELGYSYQDRWTQKNDEGKVVKTPYFSEILKKHDNDHAESIHDWLQNDGVLTTTDGRTIQGPRPEDVAKQYLQGLERLYQFVKKQVPDRPVLVRAVGHQWDLDAVATYLAKGRVTYEDWREVMGRQDAGKEDQVIGEGEAVNNITVDPKSGKMTVEYRGQNFTYEPEDNTDGTESD